MLRSLPRISPPIVPVYARVSAAAVASSSHLVVPLRPCVSAALVHFAAPTSRAAALLLPPTLRTALRFQRSGLERINRLTSSRPRADLSTRLPPACLPACL